MAEPATQCLFREPGNLVPESRSDQRQAHQPKPARAEPLPSVLLAAGRTERAAQAPWEPPDPDSGDVIFGTRRHRAYVSASLSSLPILCEVFIEKLDCQSGYGTPACTHRPACHAAT